jgi:hypothetical protein
MTDSQPDSPPAGPPEGAPSRGAEGTPAGAEGSAPDGDRCALCGASLAGGNERRVNQHRVCVGCATEVAQELAGSQATAATLPLAGLGGLGGAALGAAGWAAVAIATDYEIGFIAVAVGYLAGLGVKLGARGKRGGGLPHVAAAAAVLGLLLAKYFVFLHYVAAAARQEGGGGWLTVGIASVVLFPTLLVRVASPFDLLWVVLAIGAAWRAPAAPAVRVGA